ncbi:LacI family DNA-binding transcriptional regulator [Mariniflexile sp.]|uniref:LacI family DNA-binding transcriptional regulator n=1 Tax=Mariniflexile sp. TaxID=1979402 RepID=UPI004047F13B
MKIYTIKDIAKLAGVSKGTVDRVLHKRGKVSEKALEKVNKILEKIDYQPNPIARNLKNNKIYQICVILPNPNEDAFWSPCVEGVNEAIEEFKAFGVSITLYFYSPTSTKSFFDINNEILKTSPDAVLLTPLFHKESIEVSKKYAEANIIVSTFNNKIESNQIGSFVGQDLFQSGRVAANLMHMVVQPQSKIVIVHIDEVFNNAIHMQEKEKGFRNYFEELLGAKYDVLTLNVVQSELGKLLPEFLNSQKNVSGIFVTTSKAYKIVETLQYIDYKNVKVIGYDLLSKNIGFMKNKKIDFLIHQNPKTQTYLSLTYLVEYFLFSKDIPKQKLLPIDIVNSENLSSHIQN